MRKKKKEINYKLFIVVTLPVRPSGIMVMAEHSQSHQVALQRVVHFQHRYPVLHVQCQVLVFKGPGRVVTQCAPTTHSCVRVRGRMCAGKNTIHRLVLVT